MPLILFTGFPSSGKTTYAQKLVQILQEKIDSTQELNNYKILYYNDEKLGIKHNDYVTSKDERTLRNKITSVVRRDLSRYNIVIIDSLNYIKGFRYQLHCEVKNANTTFALFHIMSSVQDINEKYNSDSNADASYERWDSNLLNDLIARFEEPNPDNRWDSPLFNLLNGVDNLSDDSELKDKIINTIFNLNNGKDKRNLDNNNNSNKLKANSVTVLRPAQDSNFINQLENETSKVNKLITDFIASCNSIGQDPMGQRFLIRGNDINDSNCLFIQMPLSAVNIVKLQRLKRQFIQLNRLRNLNVDRLIDLYVDFLNKNL